jgi:predicted ATPase
MALYKIDYLIFVVFNVIINDRHNLKGMKLNMITQFSCTNFRNINIKELEFGKINLLLGPNNAGKSNFIKALSFGANMIALKGDVSESGFLSEVQKNGAFDILNKDALCQEIELSWRISLENQQFDYKIVFHVGKSRDDFYIKYESLDDISFNYFTCHNDNSGEGAFSIEETPRDNGEKVCVSVKNDETVFRQFDKLVITNNKLNDSVYIRETIFPIMEAIKNYFGRFYACSSSMFDFVKVRELCEVSESGKILKRDASNFVSVYNYQCSSNAEFRETFLENAKMVMHDLSDIIVEEAFGKMTMTLVRSGQQYRLADVSDGTIEALIILLILSLSDENHPALLAIDEPEVNLHPAWQKILAKWIQANGNFTQCFISTHSPDFLDEFTEGFAADQVNILVADASDKSTFRKIKKERIVNEIEEGWQLGDLYRVNDPAIGGWPW